MSSTLGLVDAVNTISTFLAHQQVRTTNDLTTILGPPPSDPITSSSSSSPGDDANESPPVHVIVLCASSVIATTEHAIRALSEYEETLAGATTAATKPSTIGDKPSSSAAARPPRLILVLCGGIGHSTALMHRALARHPRYSALADSLHGQPEARMLDAVRRQMLPAREDRHHAQDMSAGESPRTPTAAAATAELDRDTDTTITTDKERLSRPPLRHFEVLLEDKSTNCGSNAVETKKLLAAHGVACPRTVVVAQDPTMCRRTVASFAKVYGPDDDEEEEEGSGSATHAVPRPRIVGWPAFVPRVRAAVPADSRTRSQAPQGMQRDGSDINDGDGGGVAGLTYEEARELGPDAQLWPMGRFLGLVAGEVPRLRDDENGYGPRGKGFIARVCVPAEVERSWEVVRSCIEEVDGLR
ncbi:hypothetical protein JDV02_002993 [Purpureocillium takamizusanense]|uniref:DUF218 domain-containing protein n=1 Tax=Purpureocillium takamizusanense TaxID=2060973 RepID=A0A9Q8QD39_9HYPO|nr:uncharacterized protein JDV02_002993 [Purpureocillium takamizusanense]UNI16567.1 hypothetical protein JDV02_002993 [Purpureocillium takamizusanense]